MIKVSPSILSADFSDLKEEVKLLEQAGADMIHIDIMDGHFVPDITFGSLVVSSIRRHTSLPFDVHLMIERPELSIRDYVNSGADMITIHPESTTHLHKTVSELKRLKVRVGIALLPTTPLSVLDYIIEDVDLVLVMTVNPGFAGQEFISHQLSKISTLASMLKGKDVILSVDGGINKDTASLCCHAGANLLVSGSYIFNGNYKEQIESLKNEK